MAQDRPTPLLQGDDAHGGSTAASTSLTFLYPSRTIGGAQLLFARLARQLAPHCKVTVVDYPDGFMRHFLRESRNITFIDFVERRTSVRDTTVIVPLSHLVELRYMLDRGALACNYLFWSIHPDNLTHVLQSYGRKYFAGKALAASMIGELATSGHLVFMDGATLRACEAVTGPLPQARFLQIPVAVADAAMPRRSPSCSVLRLAWLGRISYDKIQTLRKIITDVRQLVDGGAVELHIIGAGTEEEAMRAHATLAGVRLIEAGVQEGAALRDYLMAHVDLGLAMGTSALEMGALGIPTALVDYSAAPMGPECHYDWLCDTPGFSLGNDAAWGIARRFTLAQLLAQVRADQNNVIGTHCFEYVRTNHSLPEVAARLLTLASTAPPLEPSRLAQLDSTINPVLHSLLYRALRSVRHAVRRVLGGIRAMFDS